jgi:hypothetical protein
VTPGKRAGIRFVPAKRTTAPNYLRCEPSPADGRAQKAWEVSRAAILWSKNGEIGFWFAALATFFTDFLIASFALPVALSALP